MQQYIVKISVNANLLTRKIATKKVTKKDGFTSVEHTIHTVLLFIKVNYLIYKKISIPEKKTVGIMPSRYEVLCVFHTKPN